MTTSAASMIFWLVAVLLLIPVSLWLLKRSGLAQGAMNTMNKDSAMLKTVGQTGIGPGQRVVTVEVNAGGQRSYLVLGVTAQQITHLQTLHTTPAHASISSEPTP